jgi:hypothetical protein
MKTLKNYQNNIREMFFVSVEKDLDLWTTEGSGQFFSPAFNYYKLNIDRNYGALFLYNSKSERQYEFITRYQTLWIPVDFKVYKYVRKIKKHFKEAKEYKKNAEKIEFFKNGISEMEKKYVKEVRKEKLNQINN